MKDYNKIRTENNILQRLQEFKQPFTKFIETALYSYSEIQETTHEDMYQFYLLQDSKQTYQNLDDELEKTALKLARLLELKEEQLKETIIQML